MKHVDGKDGSGSKYIYPFGGPYGYTPYGAGFYIESIHGDMLIGDRLPENEAEAIQYCRCANIAFREAIEHAKRLLKNHNDEFETELDKLGME